MRILADENIRRVREAFSNIGDVTTISGAAISPETIRDADALLVRSVTRVDSALLADSAVKYVGSATSGIDHVDTNYLAERGIEFVHAPGSNATSVSEYVLAALLSLSNKLGIKLKGATIGIVGAGHVGSRVEKIVRALGMQAVLHDPPLAQASEDQCYRSFDEILECEFITLHVPLTKEGPDATEHMVDGKFLESLRRGAVLINSSRGAVVDTGALKAALSSGHLAGCVLDVWEGEPLIDLELLNLVTLGTPHIAGYSIDARLRGTEMIHDALRHITDAPPWTAEEFMPVTPPTISMNRESSLHEVVCQVVDIESDDAMLREALLESDDRHASFHELRKTYQPRREIEAFMVQPEGLSEETRSLLKTLGFTLADGDAQ